MSSPTVLFILDHLRSQAAPRPCVASGLRSRLGRRGGPPDLMPVATMPVAGTVAGDRASDAPKRKNPIALAATTRQNRLTRQNRQTDRVLPRPRTRTVPDTMSNLSTVTLIGAMASRTGTWKTGAAFSWPSTATFATSPTPTRQPSVPTAPPLKNRNSPSRPTRPWTWASRWSPSRPARTRWSWTSTRPTATRRPLPGPPWSRTRTKAPSRSTRPRMPTCWPTPLARPMIRPRGGGVCRRGRLGDGAARLGAAGGVLRTRPGGDGRAPGGGSRRRGGRFLRGRPGEPAGGRGRERSVAASPGCAGRGNGERRRGRRVCRCGGGSGSRLRGRPRRSRPRYRAPVVPRQDCRRRRIGCGSGRGPGQGRGSRAWGGRRVQQPPRPGSGRGRRPGRESRTRI